MKIPRFLDVLAEVILEETKEYKARRKDYSYRHNPSSATLIAPGGRVVGACLRQLYYRATKAEEGTEVDVTGKLQMGFGDAIHDFILGKLKKYKKFSIFPELAAKTIIDPLTKEISFRLDGLITQDDGTVGGLELKTTQGRAITGRGWGIKATGPKEDHLLQIISYFATNKAIKWFALVYLARDNAYRLEYHITRDGDRYFLDGKEIKDLNFAGIKKRWMELEKYLEEQKLPPRDFKVFLDKDGNIQKTKTMKGDTKRSDWRCMYCPYAKTVCWKGEDAKGESYNAEYGI